MKKISTRLTFALNWTFSPSDCHPSLTEFIFFSKLINSLENRQPSQYKTKTHAFFGVFKSKTSDTGERKIRIPGLSSKNVDYVWPKMRILGPSKA